MEIIVRKVKTETPTQSGPRPLVFLVGDDESGGMYSCHLIDMGLAVKV
jgi:hypothetical protein